MQENSSLHRNVDSGMQLTVGLYSIYRTEIMDPALHCLPYKEGVSLHGYFLCLFLS